MKILVIGRGGREHAIAWKTAQSKLVDTVFVSPGNDGMKQDYTCIPIEETDTESLVKFALENKIDLTIVGPESALVNGIVNAFTKHGLLIFGPSKEASVIEGSKQFAKELMQKYNIPTAKFKTFSDYNDAIRYVRETGVPTVIKYDGLAAGKGVVVAQTFEEADAALNDMLQQAKFGEGKVVIEEFLEGIEFSLMALVNGNTVLPLVIAQDHKRAYDGDQGPNTGGMGAYAPVPAIPQSTIDQAVEKIMKPVAAAMVTEGKSFTGILYGGLILTKEGPKVIEFNARFGDPETEVVLPKMKSDLIQHILDILTNRETQLEWYDDVFLGVVMASKGYPGSFEKGVEITGIESVTQTVFHMGTSKKEEKWVNSGGRVLFIVGKGKSIRDARQDAYQGVDKIKSSGLFYRKDIGNRSL